MFSFDFEAHALTQQMQQTSEQLGIAMSKIVKLEAYLLLKAVIKFTHPDSQKQGRNAVARDIKRAMTPLDPSKFRNQKIAKAIRDNDIPAVTEIMKRVPGWKGWQVVAFDPMLHTAARDKRGRVQRFKKKFVLGMGQWKRLVARKQKDVGSAKASWAFGYQLTGGNLPGWIMSHVGEAQSYSYVINLLAKANAPSLTVCSTAKGVTSDPEMKRNIERAIETRTIAMASKTRRMLSDPLKYQNLFAQYQ